jgi:hypothetical protein
VLVALVAVLVLGAVASASASASSWWVAGSELASSAPLGAATTKVHEFRLRIGATADGEIACPSVELKGADIAAHDGGSVEHLIFKECRYEKDNGGGGAKCFLKSSTIESKALQVEAKLGRKSPEDEVRLMPTNEDEVLAEVGFAKQEPSCVFYGATVKLFGAAWVTLPKGREEAAEQEVVFNGEREMNFGGASADLEGAYKFKLSSGKAWSFH